MVYAQPSVHPGKWDSQTSLGFWNTNRSPNLGQMTSLSDGQQKKENLLNSEHCHSSRPQGKTERKQKGRKVPRPC